VPKLEVSGQLVSVTANAAEKVRELLSLEADPSQSALRLAVRSGCCSAIYETSYANNHCCQLRSSERKERLVAKIEER
jgi:Fe-S cluster assembly iron-binding protein IscA